MGRSSRWPPDMPGAVRALLLASAVLALAATARAQEQPGPERLVEQELAALEAANATLHESLVVGDRLKTARAARRSALGALTARRDAVERDPRLRKIYGEKVIPALARCLPDDDFGDDAAAALSEIGAAAAPALVEALRSASIAARMHASAALGDLAPRGREAIPALAEALRDPHDFIRENAAASLTKFAVAAEEARPPLVGAMGDAAVRRGVALASMRVGADLERAAPAIPRAFQAAEREAARVPGLFFAAFLALSALSLVVCVCSWIVMPHLGKTKAVTGGRSAGVEFRESWGVAELVDGLRARDLAAVSFAMRAGGFAGFGLFAFLAAGAGMLYYGSDGGWGFIGFVVLFVVVNARRAVDAYAERRKGEAAPAGAPDRRRP